MDFQEEVILVYQSIINMKYLALLFLLPNFLLAGSGIIKSGPMLAYCEYREVMIWLQSEKEAEVKIRYFNDDKSLSFFTNTVLTNKSEAYTAHLLCDSVQPGIKYNYEVIVNDKIVEFNYDLEFTVPALWQWRTDAPDFSFATGSCSFINDPEYDRPGKGYGGDPVIFKSIAQKDPDLMLWLGDNVYYREADWFTKTGMIYRMTYSRKTPEMQELLASAYNYAIWDDHDFGPNNSDRSFRNKKDALDVFKMFWGNPSYGFNDTPGCMTTFSYSDVDFFLLDNRYHRSPNYLTSDENRTILGKEQIDWLIDNLVSSQATFKVIAMGGQFLNPTKKYETYANIAPEEREYLLTQLKINRIQGVILLTGDRHHTELSILKRYKDSPILDLTVSPLTSGTHNGCSQGNDLQVEGTCVSEHNFAVLNVQGSKDQRKIIINIYDKMGELIWEKEFNANYLNR